MDAKLKADWVKALRSGEYRQTRGVLQHGDAFCCLGVLCVVAGLGIREGGDGVVGAPGGDNDAYQPIFDLLGGYKVSHQCSQRNDGDGECRPPHSFPEIADYIEKML